jgi:hypothetical protein
MKSKLEEILDKYEFQKRNSKSEIEIEFVENYFKEKFPEDYIFYLENYLEFEDFVNVEYVKLWSLENLIEINESYEIQKYIPNVIAIGSNGGGEIIGLEFTERIINCIILTPAILDEEDNIEIGNNFLDFLERLDQGKAWFD